MKENKYFVEGKNVSCYHIFDIGIHRGMVVHVEYFLWLDTKTQRPLRYLYKVMSDDIPEVTYKRYNVLKWEYNRFHYDETGVITSSTSTYINHLNKPLLVTLKYQQKRVVEYGDSRGNEWKKEWDTPCPYIHHDIITKVRQEYLRLQISLHKKIIYRDLPISVRPDDTTPKISIEELNKWQ